LCTVSRYTIDPETNTERSSFGLLALPVSLSDIEELEQD
jgi:hypothetical protein